MSATAYKHEDTIIFTVSISILAAMFLVGKHLKTAYDEIFNAAGLKYSIDPDLLRAIAQQESSMREDVVGNEPGGHHSYGLMQIYDDTAKRLGIAVETLLKPFDNIHAGAKLLASDRTTLGNRYSIDTLIASYNAGAPTIIAKGIINPAYVASVKQHYYLYKVGGQFVG